MARLLFERRVSLSYLMVAVFVTCLQASGAISFAAAVGWMVAAGVADVAARLRWAEQ
jgi:hypothetical protein